MLPVIYEGITFPDLHPHLNHLLSFPDDHPSAEIYLAGNNLSFPLKTISYKTKTNVIEFRIRSRSVGRDNLLLLDEYLEKKGYDLRRRRSHKLKLLSALTRNTHEI